MGDGTGLSQMIHMAATDIQKRNFVAMEVKKGLSAEERKQMLAKFDSDSFKKVAMVVVGEPPAAFKKITHEALLAEKRKTVADEVRAKRHAADRVKAAEKAKKRKEDEKKKKE